MRVLVTAASKHGSAAEIANVIGGVLHETGLTVDILAPEAAATVDGYDAVVLGSGVYAGRWLDEAKRFVHRHEAALADRKVWLFSTGPLGDPPKPAGEPADVLTIEEATNAIEHRVFPGRLVKSELSFAEKVIVTGVRAPYGDFRPWDDIAAWATGISESLRSRVPVAS
jgi:menaquinone-dependent protoporphyrinogen oxidase